GGESGEDVRRLRWAWGEGGSRRRAGVGQSNDDSACPPITIAATIAPAAAHTRFRAREFCRGPGAFGQGAVTLTRTPQETRSQLIVGPNDISIPFVRGRPQDGPMSGVFCSGGVG